MKEVEIQGEFKSVVPIILMGDYVLLGKAIADDDRNGRLCFPGGGIEEGETLEEACKREGLEETNLFLKIRNKKPIVNPEIPQVAFLICDYSYGELNPNEEFEDMGRFSLKNLPWKKIYSKNIDILKSLK